MMSKNISGGCQCGAVRYRVEGALSNPHLCHCRMCQKAAGNYFMALAGAPRENVTVTRGEPGWFYSSHVVRRGFCAACGTPLFFDPVNEAVLLVTIGSLDNPGIVSPVSEDSVESRVGCLAPWPGLKQKRSTDDFSAEELAAIAAANRQHPDHETENWPSENRS